MKGATEDLGLFEILCKAVRRMADKKLEHPDEYADLIEDAYRRVSQKFHKTGTYDHNNAHAADGWRKRDRRWIDNNNFVDSFLCNAISNADFLGAAYGMVYAHLMSSGTVDDAHSTHELNRIMRMLARKPDGNEVHDHLIDCDVVFVCNDCERYEFTNEAQYPADERVCRICAEENYTWSDYEDCYIHNDYATNALDEDGNEVTIHNDNCDFVWDDDEDMYVHREYGGSAPKIIRGYHSSKGSFSPIRSEWTKINKHCFMGAELEVEVKNGNSGEKALQLHEKLNAGHNVGYRAFFEHDGSLSYGFEIITQPMGLDLHKDFWTWTEDKELRRNLLSHNTSSCGFHVHLDRRALTHIQLNKMITFVNHPDNEKLIRAVARRYSCGYSKIKEKKLKHASDTNDRYEAINVTNNSTIEFRIFKGTLKYQTLMAALEFVNALRNFAAPASPAGFHLTTDRFLEFIHEGDAYRETKNLRPYIESRLERN